MEVFADQTLGSRLNPIETIIYHVAAHEFGHAIYGLDHVAKVHSFSYLTTITK
jgi:hypothetical protein